jgi:hypothetical protein
MSQSQKTDAANRHHGGPGSSHQRPDLPDPTEGRGPEGISTNGPRSAVSGGGGEQDRHHTHDPMQKGKGKAG